MRTSGGRDMCTAGIDIYLKEVRVESKLYNVIHIHHTKATLKINHINNSVSEKLDTCTSLEWFLYIAILDHWKTCMI